MGGERANCGWPQPWLSRNGPPPEEDDGPTGLGDYNGALEMRTVAGPSSSSGGGPFRRQLRLGTVRGDLPQPATRRRRAPPGHHDSRARGSTPPTPARQHPRPTGPSRNADRSCTYPPTGPGPNTGSRCGTTPSATALRDPHQPNHPPKGPTADQQEKLGRPADTCYPQPPTPPRTENHSQNQVGPWIKV